MDHTVFNLLHTVFFRVQRTCEIITAMLRSWKQQASRESTFSYADGSNHVGWESMPNKWGLIPIPNNSCHHGSKSLRIPHLWCKDNANTHCKFSEWVVLAPNKLLTGYVYYVRFGIYIYFPLFSYGRLKHSLSILFLGYSVSMSPMHRLDTSAMYYLSSDHALGLIIMWHCLL